MLGVATTFVLMLLGAFSRTFFIALFCVIIPAAHVWAESYSDEPLVILGNGNAQAFRIEIVDSPEERAVGLMHRETMPEDAGMLFCFEETKPILMWMKNTVLPLDMIFIRKDGSISSIVEDTTPFSTDIIASKEPVRFVLELNAGSARKFNIKNENTIKHSSILSCASRSNGVIERPLQ